MKDIRLSNHATIRAGQRGASFQEISSCIQEGAWSPLSGIKYVAQKTFPFSAQSPVNGKHYEFKAIDVIFADESNEIVVVTIKVYYFN